MRSSSLGQRATSQSMGDSRASSHSRERDAPPLPCMSPTVISLSISSARAQLRSPQMLSFIRLRPFDSRTLHSEPSAICLLLTLVLHKHRVATSQIMFELG